MKKYLAFLLTLAFLLVSSTTAFSQTIFPNRGGTGTTTFTGIPLGNGISPFTPLNIGSGLNLSDGSLSFQPAGEDKWIQVNEGGAALGARDTFQFDYNTNEVKISDTYIFEHNIEGRGAGLILQETNNGNKLELQNDGRVVIESQNGESVYAKSDSSAFFEIKGNGGITVSAGDSSEHLLLEHSNNGNSIVLYNTGAIEIGSTNAQDLRLTNNNSSDITVSGSTGDIIVNTASRGDFIVNSDDGIEFFVPNVGRAFFADSAGEIHIGPPSIGSNLYIDTAQTFISQFAGGGGTTRALFVNDLDGGLTVTGTIPVSQGGTGVGTITGIIKGNGTSPFTAAVAGTDYQLPYWTLSSGQLTPTTTTNKVGVGQATATYWLDVLDSTTGMTASSRTINASFTGGTYNTTAGAIPSYAGYFNSNATRSAGANALTNVGIYATASGGQSNYSGIFDAGNVGIGNTAPISKFIVSTDGSNVTTALGDANSSGTFTRSGGASEMRVVTADNVTAASSSSLILTRARGTVASPTVVSNGDGLGTIFFQGYGNTARSTAASIISEVDNSFSGNLIPGRLRLLTANTAGTITEAMRIDSTQAVGIGDTSPSSRVTKGLSITSGTLGANLSSLYVSSTIATTGTGIGALFLTTSPTVAGTASMVGLRTELLAGYTGTGATRSFYSDNQVAGRGNDLRWSGSYLSPLGNSGANLWSSATTTGTNVGNFVEALGGNLNVGLFGKAATLKNSATNIGVIGQGRNTGTSPIQIGGWFTLANAAPTYTSAALVADNGDQTSPIFLGRDNGSTVFSIIDGGSVGIGTASPNQTLDVSGGFGANIRTMTTSGNVLATDYTILCDATAGNVTVTLRTASSSTRQIIAFVKIDSTGNSCILDGNGSETISGAANVTFTTQWSNTQVQSNGTALYQIAD